MSKTKAELLEEAQAKGLDVSEENTVAELEEALKNAEGSDNGDDGAEGDESQAAPQNTSDSSVPSNRVEGDPVNSSEVANTPEYGNAFDSESGTQNPNTESVDDK